MTTPSKLWPSSVRSRCRELEAALAKVEEHSQAMATAKNSDERAWHDRMRRKWMGLAEGWRMISEIDKVDGE